MGEGGREHPQHKPAEGEVGWLGRTWQRHEKLQETLAPTVIYVGGRKEREHVRRMRERNGWGFEGGVAGEDNRKRVRTRWIDKWG